MELITEIPQDLDCAVIGLFGDDPSDYMAKCGAKWLHKNGVNALCVYISGKKNYSHVNNPLERIETADQMAGRLTAIAKLAITGNVMYGGDGFAGCSFLFPGYYLDLCAYSQ